MHRTDRADLALEGVVGAGLRRDRRGLGHAVADRHLLDSGVDQLRHHRRRARRAGHDAGAHAADVVPTRGFTPGAVLGIQQRPLGDEHRRHTVERGAPLLGHRAKGQGGVETRSGDDHAGPVRGRREVSHHHPEAVVEGHRDADQVRLRVVAELADEVAVVEDVVVREGRALGEPRRPRGVLDVDRIVPVEPGGDRGQSLGADLLGTVEQVLPRLLPDDDDVLEARALGASGLHHRRIVRALERLGDDHHRDARLAHDEGDLVRPVCRVDVDQDRTHLRRGELGEHPLGTVRRPDADPLPLLDPRLDQAPGETVDLRAQLGIRHPQALGPVDERLTIGKALDGCIEVRADGLLQQ